MSQPITKKEGTTNMKTVTSKDLAIVINSIINEDTKSATKAFHTYLQAKSQSILLGEYDNSEDYDDDPDDFDPSDEDPDCIGNRKNRDAEADATERDEEDPDFDEDGMEPPEVDGVDYDEEDRDESGFDDDMDREGNSGSLGKRRVQPLRNRLAR